MFGVVKLVTRRKLLIISLGAFFLLCAHDWIQPREREISTRTAVFAIEEYRALISPRLKGRVFCRFKPTCSEYGLESVKKYGAVIGGAKALWRIARCGPWTPMGTVDPP